MYSGIMFDALHLFFGSPYVQAAAFGTPLVMLVLWAPMRWLRR